MIENLWTFFLAIGILYSLIKLIKFVFFIKSLIKPVPKNLSTKYGLNSYALITGGSDGIGKSFAFALASQKFNLILIARNKEKLENVKQKILLKCSEIQIKIIVFDFKNSSNIELFSQIYKEIQDLDISILVNNVGIDNCNKFIDTPPEILKNLININCFPVYFLTHYILPKMLKRHKSKSAVINLSSMSGVLPTPYFSAYGATKIFIDYLTKALQREYPSIDWITVRPNFVKTEINIYFDTFESVSPEECVDGVLHDLGKRIESSGSWKHDVMNALIQVLPISIMKPIFMNVMLPKIYRHYENFRDDINKKNK